MAATPHVSSAPHATHPTTMQQTKQATAFPRPSSPGTGRTPKPRTAPAGLARGSAPSSFLQGHPPSLRFGHPDVTTEATETSTHPPNRCSYVFRKRPQGVTRTLSRSPTCKTPATRQHTKPRQPSPPQFARHGAHTLNPRAPTATPAGFQEPLNHRCAEV